MLNKIVLMGRLTRDRSFGKRKAEIPLYPSRLPATAISRRQGAEKETDFVDIVAWRGTAEFVSKYFSKGRMAVVSGRLQIRNWEDMDGNKRKTAEIVAESVYFGDSKRDGQNASAAAPASAEFTQLPDTTPVPFSGSDMQQIGLDDDDLPF